MWDCQGRSHKGQRREKNEDLFYCPAPGAKPEIFVVADGMGGRVGGEIASQTAVSALTDFFALKEGQVYSAGMTLQQGVTQANRAILNRARRQPSLSGMCTTLVCALPQDYGFLIAHVGDSRAYRFHGGELTLLTRDHSLVWEMMEEGAITFEEMETHSMKNVITRALGAGKFVDAELTRADMEPGDVLMLCSDGLSGMCSREEMAGILSEASDLKTAAGRLIDLANENGGVDNITVVLVRYAGGNGDEQQ